MVDKYVFCNRVYDIIIERISICSIHTYVIKIGISKRKIQFYIIRQFGIRKKSKELQLCRSFSMYWQSLRLVVKETICRECGAEVDEEVVYRAVA